MRQQYPKGLHWDPAPAHITWSNSIKVSQLNKKPKVVVVAADAV